MDTRTTRSRLLAAAGDLFATRGFHGTTIREIAARARVNVAAGHYHCGSKKALYLAVLREQFAEVWARLDTSGARRAPALLDRLSRQELEQLLRARTRIMLAVMIGPERTLHSTLLLREMADPSEALPVIVDEFIRPMTREMAEIIGRLEPTLDAATLERCVMSVVGQALFYRACMPLILRLWGRTTYPRDLIDQLVEHICEFSLAGMARRGQPRRGARRAR